MTDIFKSADWSREADAIRAELDAIEASGHLSMHVSPADMGEAMLDVARMQVRLMWLLIAMGPLSND